MTLFLTFIVLKLAGQSFNLMTLGGLAAAVGLVIDDAIVVLENIVLHRDAGETACKAIQSALQRDDRAADRFDGDADRCVSPADCHYRSDRRVFPALAITMTVSLFSSLLLALTWTPTLSQYFVMRKDPVLKLTASRGTIPGRGPAEAKPDVAALLAAEEAHLSGFFGRIVEFYGRVLRSGAAPAVDPGGKLGGDRGFVLW